MRAFRECAREFASHHNPHIGMLIVSVNTAGLYPGGGAIR